MAVIRVTHTIGDLADDLASMPPQIRTEGARIVRRNATQGNRIAQRLARARAGAHGAHYFKRLTSEMTGALEAEYGPEGPPKSDYVGVGGSAGAMRDLDDSADIIGPRFASDARDLLDGLFW